MGSMAQTGMSRALDTLDGKTPYTLPTLFMALTTSTPTAAAQGNEVSAGQWTNYARGALPGASWGAAAAGACLFNATITFPTSSGGSGATVIGYDIYDASGGGNRLWWGTLTSTSVTTGVPYSIASGLLSCSVPVLAAGSGYATVWANHMVEHMVGKTTMTAPGIFLALCTTASTAAAMGTELTYTSYARVTVPTASLVAAAVAGSNVDVLTSAQITWPQSGSVGGATLVGWAWMDSVTIGAGNLVAAGTIPSTALASGVAPDFPTPSTLLRIS